MTTEDPITRLNAALEGSYRIERELGEGGDGGRDGRVWWWKRGRHDLNAEGDRLIIAQNATGTVSEGGASQPDRLILVQNFFEELRQVVPE